MFAGRVAWADEEAAAPKGWIVLSMARDTGCGTAQIVLRRVGSGSSGAQLGYTAMTFLTGTRHQFAPGKDGYVIASQFPAGSYEIINFRLEYSASKTTFSSRKNFSVRFEAKPNEVTYLGEFLATAVMLKGFLGLKNVDEPYFIVSDEQERDVAIAGRRPSCAHRASPTRKS